MIAPSATPLRCHGRQQRLQPSPLVISQITSHAQHNDREDPSDALQVAGEDGAEGYMQSHHVDYFLGAGMSTPPRPNITYPVR
ncbi:hypothetical protein [Plantactinospora mayteni]|uniref:hypothetical protein n=1 Tax=Plantactinospora mayteni TaxID=566021 RepID=UPI0019440165|nr:hypothetical protein [Plantactinospora mayteni]